MAQYLNLRRGLASKAKLINMNDNIYNHITDEDHDWYISLYQYNDTHKEILKEKGTLSGIQDVVTDILYFDFDDEEHPSNAQKDAITLIDRLESKNINKYSICFSGMKGFSVEVYTQDLFTPPEFKATLDSLAGDLDTFDTTVSDPQRIVRIPNTKHQKSGLFKLPLTRDELKTLGIDEIKANAIKPNFDAYTPSYIRLPEGIKVIPKKEEVQQVISTIGFDVKNRPSQFDEARWLLNNGFFENGERNTAFLCLASFYKSLGYQQEQTYRLLKGTAELQSKRTGNERFPDEELYNNIIGSVYGPSWKGGTFSIRDPESWLFKYAKKHGIDVTQGIKAGKFTDIETDFIDFVKNIEENTIKTGYEDIDREMSITTGSILGILGPASSGKTSVTLDILNRTSKQGVTSVFASLDMYRTRIFEKLAYRVTDGKVTRAQLYDMYKNGKHGDIKKKIEEEYGNVYFYDKSSPTVQNIRDYVINVQETTGKKVKLLMIDYFERVSSDMSDDTAASKRIMGELQDLMNDLNLCIVVLYQPNKMSIGSGPDVPIVNYTAIKGSSFVFQSLRNIISICRYGQNVKYQDYDKYINFNILKNDLGTLGSYDYSWTGKTGRIRPLEDHERRELKEFLKLKELNKGMESESEWG